jgi:hypothetical protein
MLRQSVGPSRGPSAQVSSSQPMGLSRSTTKTPVDPSRDVSPQPFRCVAVGRPMDPIQKSMTKGLSRDPPMLREATGPARGPSAHVSSSQPMGLSRGPTKTLMQSKRKPSPCTRLRLCHYCTCAVASAGLKNALVLPLCGRGPVQQSTVVRTEHTCTQSSRAQKYFLEERNAQYPRPCCGPPRRQALAILATVRIWLALAHEGICVKIRNDNLSTLSPAGKAPGRQSTYHEGSGHATRKPHRYEKTHVSGHSTTEAQSNA